YQICDRNGCHWVCPQINPTLFGRLLRLRLEREALLRDRLFQGSTLDTERLARLEGTVETLIAMLEVGRGNCPGCNGGCNPGGAGLGINPFAGGEESLGLGLGLPFARTGPCPGGVCPPDRQLPPDPLQGAQPAGQRGGGSAAGSAAPYTYPPA